MKQTHPSLSLLFVVTGLSLMGCGATVASGPSPDGGPDVPVTPDAPVTPDTPVTPDAPPTCSLANAETVSITYTAPGGGAMDCSAPRGMPGGPAAVVTRTAAVLDVTDDATGSTVRLDFCSPAADCVPLVGSLRVSAPGFRLAPPSGTLRAGQFVRIRSRAMWSWGCTMQVEVSNAPEWDGTPNPVRRDPALLAAAASGEAGTLPDAPFGLSRQSIGCAMPGTNCGGGGPELFALSFQGRCRLCESDPPPVTAYQGRTVMFGIDAITYAGRNHRSFNTGACDDYWNYAWTAREVPGR